jgi:hypothetical protein
VNTPENFQAADNYVRYRPAKQCSFQEVVDLVCAAVVFARENKMEKLLVDTTQLTGFEPPETFQRFHLGEQVAKAAISAVKIAFVARPEMIDARRFGVTVARNRGLHGEVFDSEADAVAWLLDPETR